MVAIENDAGDTATHEELLRLLNETSYHVSVTKAMDKDHIALLQLSLAHPDRDVRLSALRICRLCLAMELTEDVLSTGIEYILVRYPTLNHWSCGYIKLEIKRDGCRIFTAEQHRYAVERELALKLIRTLLATKEGSCLCPKSICRVLVAVAEQNDDRLRSPCIETLCELAVLNPKLAFQSGAIKLLFTLLVEGPRDLLDAIVLTVLYLLDLPESREYIRPSVELEVF